MRDGLFFEVEGHEEFVIGIFVICDWITSDQSILRFSRKSPHPYPGPEILHHNLRRRHRRSAL